MLMAVPRQNEAAQVATCAGGGARITIRRRRPGWLAPPVSWLIRPALTATIELDALGATLWRDCDGRRNVEMIVVEFAQRHALTFHEARSAVTGYLKGLVQRGALAVELAMPTLPVPDTSPDGITL